MRRESRSKGKADDAPCLDARLPLLSRAGRLAALAQTMEVIADCVFLFEDILSHSF
jgi:hypothetical protein